MRSRLLAPSSSGSGRGLDLDRYVARLGGRLLWERDTHRQHAFVVVRAHLVGADAVGQWDATLELPVAPLVEVAIVFGDLPLFGLLTSDGENVVIQGNL